MLILSVESSCDETAVALVEDGRRVLTDQIFSQADLQEALDYYESIQINKGK